MNKKTSLSYQSREIILGSLLGDGSLKISKDYKQARFSFRHSANQEKYFWWKVKNLKEISSEHCVWKQEGENNGWGKTKFRYQSLTLPSLTELFKLTSKNNQLRVRRKWLNILSPLSLAVWWCDDGSIIGNGRRGVLCTDGFDEKSQKILAKYLLNKWRVKVHPAPIKRTGAGYTKEEYWRLWFRSAEELKKFLRIILPFIPVESMLPKVIILYKDSELQQRWISEIASKTFFSKHTIENYAREKRSKWKSFRE